METYDARQNIGHPVIWSRLVHVTKNLHSQRFRNKGGFAAISQQRSMDFPLRKFINRSLKTNQAPALTAAFRLLRRDHPTSPQYLS